MSGDTQKTRQDLIREVQALRQRVAALENASPVDESVGMSRLPWERLGQALLGQAPVGVQVYDNQGRLLYANRAWEAIWGVEATAYVGTYNLFEDPQLEKTGLLPQIKPVLSGEVVLFDDYAPGKKAVALNGDSARIRAGFYPLTNEDGHVAFFMAVNEDVTELLRAEQALRKSEDTARTLLNATTDLAVLVQTDGTCIAVNDAAAQALGVSSEQLRGKRIYDLFEAAVRETREQYAAMAVQTGMPVRYEEENARGIFDIHIFPVIGEGARVERLAVFPRDVTEERREEDERRALELRVQRTQKNESLAILAGGIAHDFNNLLVGILGNASLALEDGAVAGPTRRCMEEVVDAAKRAAELSHQMLAYSGKGKAAVAPVDLNAIVREMHGLLDASLSRKAALRYELAPDLPAVEGDATQLRQVAMNLVLNASEALGDKAGVVILRTGCVHACFAYLATTTADDALSEGRYVYLEVQDTGSGMDDATQRRIFDPFYTTKFTGRGLGLAATLGIVRGHGGAIHVDSSPGRGSTFRVLLPASIKAPTREVTDRVRSAGAWHGTGIAIVADADATVRDAQQRMLARLGFAVMPAATAREALALLDRHRADVVCAVLGVNLPDVEPEEMVEAVRRIRPGLPVILSSGYPRDSLPAAALRDARVGFIQKPYDSATLTDLLAQVLAS